MSARNLAGAAGFLGGALFFVGDMLMYGHFGPASGFREGALQAVLSAPLWRLYLGGLVGPVAAGLCMFGFWHVYQNMAAGLLRRLFLGLSLFSMLALGAVHTLWVAKGLARRACALPAGCGSLRTDTDAYWDLAYYLGAVPAYLACALLAIAVLRGRSDYPRWTVVFNPAASLLIAPLLAYAPGPWGAPLVGGDVNLFIAVFFAVSCAATWQRRQPRQP